MKYKGSLGRVPIAMNLRSERVWKLKYIFFEVHQRQFLIVSSIFHGFPNIRKSKGSVVSAQIASGDRNRENQGCITFFIYARDVM